MALIELRGIRKIYKMGNQEVAALNGVDLEVQNGEYLSIIGPSGSGKSTLMHLLGCLDLPSDGTMVLDSVEINSRTNHRLSKIRCEKIGFVFQSFNLLPKLDVFQNVELPLIYAGISRKQRRERVLASLQAVGLGDRISHRPNQLSGGQNQRVAIARALVNRPKIILADEPTGALDSRTGETILELFRDLHRQGNTVILVTHDHSIAEETNRKIEILDGKIVSDQQKESHPS